MGQELWKLRRRGSKRHFCDASGNSYTIGYFEGINLTVGTTTLITAVPGGYAMYVIKQDSSGSPLWAKSFGGSEFVTGNAIAVDASGNSYATGYFRGSLPVGNTTLTAVGGTDICVIKLDASGSPLWAKSFGSSGSESGIDIAVDASGDSYTTGEFQGSLLVGHTTLTAVGLYDMFVIKLNATGNPLWATSFASSLQGGGYGIGVDAAGNSYTTGYFRGSITVGTTTLTAVGSSDMFVIKLNATGSPLWAKSFGSESATGQGIAVDTLGNSYTTGYFQGHMAVGPITLTDRGDTDICVIKLDASGSPLWAKSFGGSGEESGIDIAVDASGNSYITGFFPGGIVVGPTTLTAVGLYDMFVIKLNATGSPLWARSFGGNSLTMGNGIGVDASGCSYTTGYFRGTLMTVETIILQNLGEIDRSSDIFVIKLC